MTTAMLARVVALPLLGGLTGLRTMTPMAVLCWFAYRGDLHVAGTWGFWSAKLVTVLVFTFFAAGEFVGDKLPQTPNRTDAFPLLARIGFGTVVGALCATAQHGPVVAGGLLGGVSAVVGAFAGFHLRRFLVKVRHLPDLRVALVEDAIAVGLAIFAMHLAIA